jgi:TonB-linked SusC/RagA family outer membrane protein
MRKEINLLNTDFMTNYHHSGRTLVLILLILFLVQFGSSAQETGFQFSGKVQESGSGLPVSGAVVSVISTGEFTNTSEEGKFSILLPSPTEQIMVNYPGFHTINFYTTGNQEQDIFLTRSGYHSDDEVYTSLLGEETLRNATNSISVHTKSVMDKTAASSSDQTLSGKIAGLQVIEHSGMPGHSSWLNLRGISSIFGRNEPLVFIDGMIYEIDYTNNSLIEGHLLNPMDIVDVDDIEDITAIKIGEAQLGSAGSNGVLYINTEQRKETSSTILIKLYGGIALSPARLDVMDDQQFKPYFNNLLIEEGYSPAEINNTYSWLDGGGSPSEYYRYGNNTDWQKELFQPAAFQKYHIFLKGGDDIATYNISSGFLLQGAPYDQWRYSRYNLRLNGKINISNRISVVPHTKLSLSDSYLTNMGPTTEINPVTSSLLKPSVMAPHERSQADGTELFPYDDVGAFNVSNPAVLIDGAMGSDRNFQFLSSVKINFIITPELTLSNLTGTNVNNDRVNIFIPDVGVVQIDSARNSPQDMVTEFRSTQNHTTLTYKKTFNNRHYWNIVAGMRYMSNTYKNNLAIDLNTPSDDFRSLGQGSEYEYLQSHDGELSQMIWLSYFTDMNYAYRDKYYIRVSASCDGSSAFNSENRYNFYPSVFGAWRLTSEDFFNAPAWMNDLKVRAAYSQTGNMFSSIYDYSKLSYTGRRYNSIGVVVRDYNPNPELKAEKRSTINAGLDMSFTRKAYNLHFDYYLSNVNNLVINQSLPYNFGFTDYYDNGGKLRVQGFELSADARFYLGKSVLVLDATATHQTSKITSLDFINPETEFILREVYGAEYIASVGNPVNAFYGFKTDGIYATDAEANGILGPGGRVMGAGDVIFVDTDNNNIIDDRDKQIIGNPNPDLFGSLSASLNFGRWEISTLLTYSVGNDVYNYVRYKTTSMDSYANQSIDVINRWYPGATNATLPHAVIGDPAGNNVFSDRWIEDGSYLRLRQIMISYTTPTLFHLQKEATLYITGTNLLTLTGYSGYDPETMYLNDPYYMGIDYGKIPLARSIIVGIQLSL